MANVMSLKKLRNHVHRNGFDLSRRNAFTAKVGELLPVLCEEVIPGDKFKIKPEWFTRTRPLNTAAYTRVREYYDFYFVPYRLMWKGFDNFITQMDNPTYARDITTSAAAAKRTPYITTTSLMQYIQKLRDFCAKNTEGDAVNEVGLNRFYATLKLLNYLNYGSLERQLVDLAPHENRPNISLSVFPLLAYQKIYQDFYRNQQWESAAPYLWNVDYINGYTTPLLDLSQLYEQWDTLDEVHLNMFDLRYCNWNKDMFFGLLPSPQFGDESFAPINIRNSYSAITKIDATNNYSSMNAAASGNMQWLQSSGRAGYVTVDGSAGTSLSHSHTAKTTLSSNVTTDGLSILALRQAEALQKWKEISLSGNQDFRTQMKKHWGVDVGVNRSDLCQYIGGSVSNVTIGEVVNNNITADNIADIAGKGVGSGNGFVDFESKDYGIIMCIYHAVPLLDYESVGIKRMNTKITAQDFAIPEFDSVGMQQVLKYQLCFGTPNEDLDKSLDVFGVLGYAPRYIEYKTAVDEIHGGFMSHYKDYISQQGFPSWVAPLNYNRLRLLLSTDATAFNYSTMKVNPVVLDSIFSGTIASTDSETGDVTYDNTLSTDQLLCNAFFDVKVVRNLDYDGLPY